MRIKEIELDNFKSFGKPTRIPILAGFTTISGPNGSGKSNIVDSLLFALGLSTTRTMRAERLPDLLNNLSGKNEARVTVRITNDIDTEIEVTRRLKVKDNGYTSTYMLNGKVSTLSDIHEELTKYNVSPTGFNVIMQGDVTSIVTMSGTERRKIIDELAGVAEFERRIEQANRELEAVAEKIERERIVLVEIQNRLVILQADRDQALKYLDLKQQKERLEKDLLFVRVRDIEIKAQAELSQKEKLAKNEQSLCAARAEAEVNLLSARAETGKIEQEIREKGGNEQLLLRQEVQNQRGDLTREENKLSNLQGVISEKSKLHKSVTAQIKSIDKHLQDLDKDKKVNEADLKATQLVFLEKQGLLSAVLAEIEVIRQEKDRSSSKVLNLHEDLEKLREEKHKLAMQQTELILRKEGSEKDLETLRNAATNSISKAAAIKGLIQSLEQKFQEQQAQVAGIARSIRQLESEIESTSEEIEQKRHELDSLNRKLIELETTFEVAGESGWGKAVEAVLSANLDGVYGTIGQLGQADENYTVALEVAIGQRMSHIVVENDSLAQQCIEILKETKSGRATFIPLNKIMTQPPGLLPSHKGVIDFAYNLINFNPKFTKAFQYACGQTIVVENLEIARKLINTARLVTIDGELLEKYGTISGGTDIRQRMRFLASGDNNLSLLKQKIKNLSEDIRFLQDSLKELNLTCTHERNKLNDARSQQAQNQAELDSKQTELKSLEKEIEDLKPRLRIQGNSIETIDADIAQANKAIQELEKQITKLQDELSETTGGGKQSKVDCLVAEAEELKADLDNIEKSVKDVERQLDRIEAESKVELASREGLKNQLDSISKEIEDLSSKRPEHEQHIGELKNNIHELELRITNLSGELQSLHDTKDKIQEKITGVEVEKTKIDQQLVRLTEEAEECQQRYEEYTAELAKIACEIEQLKAEQPDYEPPSAATSEQLAHQIERLAKRIQSLEPVNMKALDEYKQTQQRQDELNEYLDTLNLEKEEINQRIASYGELKKQTFMEAFEAINHNFQEIFAELSHGHGRLELENADNPFEGGLIIRAQPRDKKMQRIEALSGGEKSLTALSFVFAFQRYAPAPFYAFDEVDMMLDGSNAERLARMVKQQSLTAQFVVVSLRRPMIENANHAIGVSLRADGYSKVVGISDIQLPEEEAASA